jgi:hypothetical protein
MREFAKQNPIHRDLKLLQKKRWFISSFLISITLSNKFNRFINCSSKPYFTSIFISY